MMVMPATAVIDAVYECRYADGDGSAKRGSGCYIRKPMGPQVHTTECHYNGKRAGSDFEVPSLGTCWDKHNHRTDGHGGPDHGVTGRKGPT